MTAAASAEGAANSFFYSSSFSSSLSFSVSFSSSSVVSVVFSTVRLIWVVKTTVRLIWLVKTTVRLFSGVLRYARRNMLSKPHISGIMETVKIFIRDCEAILL